MQVGVKFIEISAGVGCNIDTLLVGIVMQVSNNIQFGTEVPQMCNGK